MILENIETCFANLRLWLFIWKSKSSLKLKRSQKDSQQNLYHQDLLKRKAYLDQQKAKIMVWFCKVGKAINVIRVSNMLSKWG